MKLTQITLALSALLATAAAQGLSSLPDCAKSCATSSIPSNCGIDVKCICTSKSFLSDISCCVANKCSQADQETTLKAAKSICASGGVSDLPDSVTCSTGTGSDKTATDTSSGSATATNSETMTTSAATTSTGSSASSQAGSSSTDSSAAATSGAAVIGQNKDTSFVAAAGAAAAFAFFI